MEDKSKRAITITRITGFIAIGMALTTVAIYMVVIYLNQ